LYLYLRAGMASDTATGLLIQGRCDPNLYIEKVLDLLGGPRRGFPTQLTRAGTDQGAYGVRHMLWLLGGNPLRIRGHYFSGVETLKKFQVPTKEPGSDLVPVVWYETIHRWENSSRERMPSLFFHKIATLTKFRLEEMHVRVPLPYSWYLFGTAAEELPHSIQFYSLSDSNQTLVHWVGEAPDVYPGDHTADSIRTVIDDIIREYPAYQGERAVDEVYQHAPFPFQRSFRRVRIAMGVTGHGSEEQNLPGRLGGLWSLVVDAFDEFDYDRFSQLSFSASAVREAVKVALDMDTSVTRGLAVELLEGFWRAYAEFLRLQPEGHSNVSSRKVQLWRDDAESRRAIFERNLGDIVVELSSLEPNVSDDGTLGPLARKRGEERAEESQMIEEGLEVLALSHTS